MVTTTRSLQELRSLVGDIPDPEIPVVSIAELGILRDVSMEDGTVVVTITPTYSGCPAMDAISDDITAALAAVGAVGEVRMTHTPPWTTDWMSPGTKQKLADYGIAPPDERVVCPQCASSEVRTVSRFGSTACKALLVCDDCGEPFDHFKVF